MYFIQEYLKHVTFLLFHVHTFVGLILVSTLELRNDEQSVLILCEFGERQCFLHLTEPFYYMVGSFTLRLCPLLTWGCRSQPPLRLWPSSPTQMSIDWFLLACPDWLSLCLTQCVLCTRPCFFFLLQDTFSLVFLDPTCKSQSSRINTPAREVSLGVCKRCFHLGISNNVSNKWNSTLNILLEKSFKMPLISFSLLLKQTYNSMFCINILLH